MNVRIAPNRVLRELLSKHPRIVGIEETPGPALVWNQGDWTRDIHIGRPEIEPSGLVELIDNNPMICADRFSLPGPLGTIALIGLGPLVRAGLLAESPTVIANVEGGPEALDAFLAALGWEGSVEITLENKDLEGVASATVMAPIRNPEEFSEIDDLYEEAYGRSFFVNRDEDSEWHIRLVKDSPRAVYRLRLTPGESHSLLTMQVMSDIHGKCGEAQIVHAFNVMAGFEESLGLG